MILSLAKGPIEIIFELAEIHQLIKETKLVKAHRLLTDWMEENGVKDPAEKAFSVIEKMVTKPEEK